MEKVSVTLLLDETGSMESIRDDTIGGFNSYLRSLKALDAEVAFTLLKFDSNRVEKVHVRTAVGWVPELTRATYQPGAMTPLWDAAVKAIRATEAAQTDGCKVIVVIQTDGHENASREHTLAELQDLVKAKTAAGWEFVFLGAGFDAYASAQAMGIAASGTVAYSRDRSAATFNSLAANTRSYVCGQSVTMGFDEDQKAEMGDQWQQPAGSDPLAAGDHFGAGPVPPRARAGVPRRSLINDIDLSAG